MYKLDWGKITNDKDFQRLANDVVWFELGKPGFIPSSPYIGADGGWDGRNKGEYMGIDGLWSFQAKFTEKSLDAAFEDLKAVVKDELDKARENKVDNLVIITKADLRIGEANGHGQFKGHVMELEKLNTGQVKNLYIWHREKLEMLINKWPWIRFNYFQVAQYPKFIPGNDYNRTIEKSLLGNDLIDRDIEFDKIIDFLKKDNSKAIILHAPGGCGKSHFLKQFLQFYYNKENERQILFCRPGIGDFDQAINNDLNDSCQYVLVLDDAERYLDDSRKMISLIKSYGPDKFKIILACRTSGQGLLLSEFARQEIHNSECLNCRIANPSKEALESILCAAAGRKVEKADRIINTLSGNLYLIVATGKLMVGGVEPSDIKNKLKDILINESLAAVNGEIGQADLIKLIRELALIVPFSESDGKAIQIISEELEINHNKLSEIINSLEKGEILRRVGSSLRFNPDMKGDIFLSMEIDSVNGEKIAEEGLKQWMPYCPDKIVANIADASRHNDTDNVKKVVCRFIQSFVDKAEEDDKYRASRNLNLISRLVYLCPDKAADLVSIYLDKIPEISRDDIGKIIQHFFYIYNFHKQSVNFIRCIAQKKLTGMYNNYEAKSLVKDFVSPIDKDLLLAINAIDELYELVENEDCSLLDAELACYGASEALAGTHEYRETYGITMTYGRKILRYDVHKASIDQYRNKAMLIAEKLLFHKNKELAVFGIDIIENIGEEGDPESLLSARILEDKKNSLILIEKFLKETDNFRAISKTQDILIRIWANNNFYPSCSESAEKILKEYNNSPEYILFRYFNARDLIIKSFEEIVKNAPSSDRWPWLVHNHFRRFDVKQDELDAVLHTLSEKYETAEEILKFLKKIDTESEESSKHLYVPVVETWGKFNGEKLLEIFDSPDYSKISPESKCPRFFLARYCVAFLYFIKDKIYSCIKKYLIVLLNKKVNIHLLIRIIKISGLTLVNDNKQIPFRYYKGFVAVKCKSDPDFLNKYVIDIISNEDKIKDFGKIEVFLSLVTQSNLDVNEYIEYVTEILKSTTPAIKSLILHRSYFIFNEKYKEDRDKVIDVLLASLQDDVNEHVLDMFAFLFSHLSEWNVRLSKDSALAIKLLDIIRDIPQIDYNSDELLKYIYKDDLAGFLDFVEYRLNKLKKQWETESGAEHIDPIPYDGFTLLGELVVTYENFKILMEKMFEWDSQNTIFSFDKEHILNARRSGAILKSNYLIDYINEKSDSKNKDDMLRAISALECLDFGSESWEVFLKVLNASLELGLLKNAKEAFIHQVVTGSYSSTIGQAPSALVSKKDCLVSMQQACTPGEVRNLIEDLLLSVNRDIQRHIDEGEEIINPK